MSENNKTLLIILQNGSFGDSEVYLLMHSETGEVLASHICSSKGFAKGDLYNNRPGRKEKLKERFGEIEVKHIDETDITIDQIVERNKANFELVENKLNYESSYST